MKDNQVGGGTGSVGQAFELKSPNFAQKGSFSALGVEGHVSI